MILDATDRRALAIVAWIAALVGFADVLSARLGLKYVQEVEWPTDLYALQQVHRGTRPDVAIIGSSRAHYGLSPSAIDLCLSDALGRRTETLAANRLTASTYATDIVARDVFGGPAAPRAFVVEVAPESLHAHHFELDYNVASTAAIQDIPECAAVALTGPPALAACARPLLRGVENAAFLLHRGWTDTRHIEWMALYHDGGQYCFDDDACRARNQAYDDSHRGRWDARVAKVLPRVTAERFADYAVGTGLPSAHFVTLLDRARADGAVVFVVNMPVSALYHAQIPPEDQAAWLAWITPTIAAHGARFLDYDTPEWRDRRDLFLDPDHLNARGALLLSNAVCAALTADALH